MMLTQYEMPAHIDSVGLLKIDFLGLETLTEVEDGHVPADQGPPFCGDKIPEGNC